MWCDSVEIVWPMALGSLILATASAIPTYFAILRIYRSEERTGREDVAVEAVETSGSKHRLGDNAGNDREESIP